MKNKTGELELEFKNSEDFETIQNLFLHSARDGLYSVRFKTVLPKDSNSKYYICKIFFGNKSRLVRFRRAVKAFFNFGRNFFG